MLKQDVDSFMFSAARSLLFCIFLPSLCNKDNMHTEENQ